MKNNVIEASIEDLIPDDKNANLHTEDGLRIIGKSIDNLGLGRSILIDKNNKIIAGNGVTKTAKDLDYNKVKIIETDGTELIAVKRTDVDLNSKKGRELAIVDNHSAVQSINLDRQILIDLQKEYKLDYDTYEIDTSSVFADIHDYSEKELDYEGIKFPITISVKKEQSEKWREVKEKIGINKDEKAHIYLIQLCEEAGLI